MTTHFTSGVTNVATGDWVITTTEGGSGDATEALGDGDGGLLVVTNDDADNDSDEFQWAGGSGGVIESFKYEATKGLYFKTRFKVNDATETDFAIGLIITDTTIIDGVTDGIYFRKADGATSIELVIEKDSTETTVSCGDAADDTFMTLGYYYDPKDRKFHVYKDNVKVGTGLTTNVPDDEELAVSFAIQNGAAAAKVMTLDYISAGKERTANTEL